MMPEGPLPHIPCFSSGFATILTRRRGSRLPVALTSDARCASPLPPLAFWQATPYPHIEVMTSWSCTVIGKASLLQQLPTRIPCISRGEGPHCVMQYVDALCNMLMTRLRNLLHALYGTQPDQASRHPSVSPPARFAHVRLIMLGCWTEANWHQIVFKCCQ